MDELNVEELMSLSEALQIPFYSDIQNYPLIREGQSLVPYQMAKQKGLIPVQEEIDRVVVAFTGAHVYDLILELSVFLQKKIEPIFCTKEAFSFALRRCYQHQYQNKPSLEIEQKEKKSIEEVYALNEEEVRSDVVGFLNGTLIESLRRKASDIHFDPYEKKFCIRIRIDGILVVHQEIPVEFAKQLTTRIKVLARLDISETRLPQDGRIKVSYIGKEIDFRVSVMPAVYGERVVLRILDNSQLLFGLNEVGMGAKILNDFRRSIRRSQGLVLVTGPTGSGKTSTLYGGISELDSRSLNIMTIEDPVEFKLDGLAQINVNHKIDFTFAKGLKHILRQDPDVILVGEIRDKETAEIAIQAALTGHLVVSTLHTNDAPSALTRLVDMGIEPFLIASCVNGILAQRLVRRLCPHCKVVSQPSTQETQFFGFSQKDQVFRAAGCPSCFSIGYQGRVGLYEWMEMSERIKKQLMVSQNSDELKSIAQEEGMISLKESGKNKVIEGISSCEEVTQVVS